MNLNDHKESEKLEMVLLTQMWYKGEVMNKLRRRNIDEPFE